MRVLGIDTGGTFTDFVLVDEGRVRLHKRLSTPQAPERAILAGVQALLGDTPADRLVHGSTVATNAVLEDKGARVAMVLNEGFADLLTIGRQARAELYNLQPDPVAPPVPPALCQEVAVRRAADGTIVQALSDAELARIAAAVDALDIDAVAISLLFAYLSGDDEQRLAAALQRPGRFVCCSSDVLPEMREYERGIATWLNARVGPVMSGYLGRLREGLGANIPLAIMQSSGETLAADAAAAQAVRLLLSGPAGGLAGAMALGRACGEHRLLSFDMGGTSTDVALLDGRLRLSSEGRIGRYPVAVPMVDMHTIGAGGGSLARIDAAGLLLVGPASAGAEPGPACYGRGGIEPTVTDANLILGRLPASARLGGDLPLDLPAARRAFEPLADRMGGSLEQAAEAVIRLANEHMSAALRVISVQRGEDPRDYALMAFGGAGGLHVCDLAEALAMRRAVVPPLAGVLSAYGMLAAAPGRQLSRALVKPLTEVDAADALQVVAELVASGRQALVDEGIAAASIDTEVSADLRYLGQSSYLNVPWHDAANAGQAFHALHEQRYGHRLDHPLELVNLRVAVRAPAVPPVLSASDTTGVAAGLPAQACHGIADPVPCLHREALASGERLLGPAIVVEPVGTTWLAPGWRATVHSGGALMLSR